MTSEQLFSVTLPASNYRSGGSLYQNADEVVAVRKAGPPAAHVQAKIR